MCGADAKHRMLYVHTETVNTEAKTQRGSKQGLSEHDKRPIAPARTRTLFKHKTTDPTYLVRDIATISPCGRSAGTVSSSNSKECFERTTYIHVGHRTGGGGGCRGKAGGIETRSMYLFGDTAAEARLIGRTCFLGLDPPPHLLHLGLGIGGTTKNMSAARRKKYHATTRSSKLHLGLLCLSPMLLSGLTIARFPVRSTRWHSVPSSLRSE